VRGGDPRLARALLVLGRKAPKRARLRNIDRLILVSLSRPFPSVLDAIVIVKPEFNTFGLVLSMDSSFSSSDYAGDYAFGVGG
jgi:hypothetical protein